MEACALAPTSSALGTWFANRPDADLHSLGTKHPADLHLFNDNEYMWRNLLNGNLEVGHFPILQADAALQMMSSCMTESEGK
jgi:hypothetical protein